MAVACLTAAAGSAAASTRPAAPRCGAPAAFNRSAPLGRAVALGDLLWLAEYPYQTAYPTKVVVRARRRLAQPVELRGEACDSGRALRFWYRDTEPKVPMTPAQMRTSGSTRAWFGPWPSNGMRGGYFLFTSPQKWKVTARINGRIVAAVVMQPRQ